MLIEWNIHKKNVDQGIEITVKIWVLCQKRMGKMSHKVKSDITAVWKHCS